MVQKRFGVAERTAKRDLQVVRKEGMIEYVPKGRDGHYRLRARR